MKRFLVLATLVAVAAVPGTTTASTSTGSGDAAYAARAGGGGNLKLSFDIRSVGGKPKQIREFEFRGLRAACSSGEPRKVRGQIGTMKINDKKKFSGNVKRRGGKVAVKGVLRQGGKKARGTIRASGRFGSSTGCDSGKVRWIAERD